MANGEERVGRISGQREDSGKRKGAFASEKQGKGDGGTEMR